MSASETSIERPPSGGERELVRLSDVGKSFPGVRALDGVNLSIRSGEVLALVGENGAGKSTLMKILSGVYPAGTYEGHILIADQAGLQPVAFNSPLAAEKSGVAIIHQELSSFPNLTIAENLYVGHWPATGGMVNWTKLHEQAKYWLDQVGAKCSPDAPMSSLSVGTQQMVEIAKALSRNSKILILDEPTSALTPPEVTTLFGLIAKLKTRGTGLVYISHKMDEIYTIADRITVLRDGKSVHSALATELKQESLIEHMVGRPLNQAFPVSPPREAGEVVLSVKNLLGRDRYSGRALFGPITFELKRGEILGFSGLLGAGRSELMEAIFGHHSIVREGEVRLNGQILDLSSPLDALRHGISFVGEDRKHDSILPKRPLEENVTVSRLVSKGLARILNLSNEYNAAAKGLKRFNTRCTGPEQEIQNLSGGNQQKAVIARALETLPEVIILDEPTRGIDVGAKFEIYEILFNLAKEGKALLVVSSDLPEIIGLCDRVIVLAQGEFMGCLNRNEFSQPTIMKLAVGKAAASA